ncbi:hypothetical protein PsorP6_015128 [Peronosclerospora sorghi]|uniref:Uncharacterized protein n=1 Tax=Peronosclerospora sorghi TaxID=230839 RepID=A0ACC0VRZ9_9STRA|nr:hypothetical protein PsorP6_015128 [Peronosclerospora sorghi]
MMLDNRELGFDGDLGLCDVDWEVIRFLDLHVLKHFMVTEKFLEGSKYVTISKVPAAIRMLREDLRKAVADGSRADNKESKAGAWGDLLSREKASLSSLTNHNEGAKEGEAFASVSAKGRPQICPRLFTTASRHRHLVEGNSNNISFFLLVSDDDERRPETVSKDDNNEEQQQLLYTHRTPVWSNTK